MNWLLPPTRKYGERTLFSKVKETFRKTMIHLANNVEFYPTTELSERLANFSVIMRMPAISLAQSSTEAFDQKRSSSLWLEIKFLA